MSYFTFTNFINTTLASSISSSATTLTVSSSMNLPSSIPSGSVLALILNDVATRQNFEIVYATAVSGATLTIQRGQESTAAAAWANGSYVYSAPTAGQMRQMYQLFGTVNSFSTSNRHLGTTYTNSSGKPMFLSVSGLSTGTGQNIQATVNGAAVSVMGAYSTGQSINASAIVPAGGTYYVQNGSSGSFTSWTETA
jgi:hypothetical protein